MQYRGQEIRQVHKYTPVWGGVKVASEGRVQQGRRIRSNKISAPKINLW